MRAQNPALDAAILADPDDETTYLVYADWLQQQGDPRGELAAAQAAGDDERAAALIEAHHDELFDGLNDRIGKHRQRQLVVVSWRLGWFEEVRLVDRAYGLTRPYTQLCRMDSARFIRDLAIEVGNDGRLIQVVGEHGIPWPLRRFAVTTMTVNLGDLAGLWARVPRIRELSLSAMSFELGRIELPRVERARLACQSMTSDNLNAIASAHWPRLRRLEIGFLPGERWREVGRHADPAVLRELLLREDLGQLSELAITGCSNLDEIVPELVGSPLLARLRRLELNEGQLSADGAEVFLRHAEAFAHLESLELRSGSLPARLTDRLAARFPQLRLPYGYADEYDEDVDDGA